MQSDGGQHSNGDYIYSSAASTHARLTAKSRIHVDTLAPHTPLAPET